MTYIVRLFEKLTQMQHDLLVKNNCSVIYESKLIPVVGIETDNIDALNRFDFVKSYREPEVGHYAESEFLSTFTFEPPMLRRDLLINDLCGWGDIRIVVIDSGVNEAEIEVERHKDFTGTGTMDLKPHGTIIAKIIKYFAKGAHIYSAKVGAYLPDEMNVMQALEWAHEIGAQLVNISSGFRRKNCYGSCELCEMVKAVSAGGIIVVAAAGNEGNIDDSIYCPGVSEHSLTVGAIDKNSNIADFSSFGKKGSVKPNVVTSGNVYIDGIRNVGTSFSAPIVTGILGAIYSRCNGAHGALKMLTENVDDLGLPQNQQGLGAVSLQKLVEAIKNEENDSKSEEQK